MWCNLSHAFQLLFKAPVRVIKSRDRFMLKQCVASALTSFEQVLPKTEHAIMSHLPIELVNLVCKNGPLTCVNDLLMERFMHNLAVRTRDRCHPEKALINVHRLEMATQNAVRMFDA